MEASGEWGWTCGMCVCDMCNAKCGLLCVIAIAVVYYSDWSVGAD